MAWRGGKGLVISLGVCLFSIGSYRTKAVPYIPSSLHPPVVNISVFAFTFLSVNSPLAMLFSILFCHFFLLTLLCSLLEHSGIYFLPTFSSPSLPIFTHIFACLLLSATLSFPTPSCPPPFLPYLRLLPSPNTYPLNLSNV